MLDASSAKGRIEMPKIRVVEDIEDDLMKFNNIIIS